MNDLYALAGIYTCLEMMAGARGLTMKQVRKESRAMLAEAGDGTGTDEGGEEGDVRDEGEWGADSESD